MNPAIPEIGAWLEALHLGQYAQAFVEHDIDGTVLAQLSTDDLREIGIASLGHRKRILAAIAAARDGKPARPSDLPDNPVTAPADGERREVTILFADLCGFTALSRTLDPEELHDLVARYTAAVDRIVETYGGKVDKHIGDAVMALFGAPIAYGDDPLRAARCGLEIHASVAELGRQLGRSLEAHVGIASGEVVAGSIGRGAAQDYTVLGDSVNLAARLVALAKPGQTLLSHAVRHRLASRAVCDEFDAVNVKGFDQPVGVWALRSIASETDISRTAFIGRAAELEQFKGAVAACLRNRSGQTIYLRGDPGIGKTRLVEEMARLAEASGFSTHRGLTLDFGMGSGQDPIRTVVRSLLGVPPGGDEPARRAAAVRALTEGLANPDQDVFLHDLLDIAMTPAMRSRYDAMDNSARNQGKRELIAALIEAISRQRSLMIVVEDLHWADALTLTNLAAIAAAVTTGPALLVLTSRREGQALDADWRARCADTPLTTIDLGPLRRAEALAFAGGFIDPNSDVVLQCVDRAGGNPLFLEQLLRHAGDGTPSAVPPSIQSLVLARMDRLPPPDRHALQAASILGQRIELATLQYLMEQPDYRCTRLMEHALLRPDGEAFLFAHALVQEGIYASLLRVRRRALHRRAAGWFAERDPALHAQHLERAEDEAAARAYLQAARVHRAAFHQERSLEMVRRGLAIVRADADRHALMCLQGDLLTELGVTTAATDVFRAALAIRVDDIAECHALMGLAAALRISEGLDEALALLDRAEAIAAAHDSVEELTRIHHLRGNILFPLGRIDRCRAEHERSLAFARRSGSPVAEARALGGLGDAAYAQGRMRSAFGFFSDCVELCRRHGFGRIEVANRSMVGFSRLYLNEAAQAQQDGIAAVSQAVQVGHLRAEMLGETMGMFASYELGDFAAVGAHAARSRSLAQRLGAHRFEVQNLEFEGRVLLAAGDADAAAAKLREALALGGSVGLQFTGPKTLSALAMATRDMAERRALLQEADQLLARGAVGHNHLWFYRDAMETMLLSADPVALRGYADRLEAYAQAEPLPWTTLFVDRGRMLADALDGRPVPEGALDDIRRRLVAAGLLPYVTAMDGLLARS